MVLWVFGYGSLIWKAGFNYDERLPGFIKGFRRVFYQGSTDHRGTPDFPGRTVTLEPADDEEICCGVAYKVSKEEDIESAITHLEVREKQYDKKVHVDFYTDTTDSTPAVTGVVVYIASSDKKSNANYLGPAPLEDIAKSFGYAGKLYLQKVPQGLTETTSSILRKHSFSLGARMPMYRILQGKLDMLFSKRAQGFIITVRVYLDLGKLEGGNLKAKKSKREKNCRKLFFPPDLE